MHFLQLFYYSLHALLCILIQLKLAHLGLTTPGPLGLTVGMGGGGGAGKRGIRASTRVRVNGALHGVVNILSVADLQRPGAVRAGKK